jgi:hypothetical protein
VLRARPAPFTRVPMRFCGAEEDEWVEMVWFWGVVVGKDGDGDDGSVLGLERGIYTMPFCSASCSITETCVISRSL